MIVRRALPIALFLIGVIGLARPQSIPFPGPGNSPAIVVVGIGSSSVSTGVSSQSITTTAAINTGDLVVVAIGVVQPSGISVSSVSDGTNTYTKAVGAFNATTFLDTEIWYKANAAAVGSGATITATLSTGTSGSPGVMAAARAGGTSTVPLDKTNHTEYTTGSTLASGTTGTLTQAKEVVFGVAYLYNVSSQTTLTESSGFTNLLAYTQGVSPFVAFNFAYQVVNATSALNYSPTPSQAVTGAGSNIATFKGN